jgi:hypothetical protein
VIGGAKACESQMPPLVVDALAAAWNLAEAAENRLELPRRGFAAVCRFA